METTRSDRKLGYLGYHFCDFDRSRGAIWVRDPTTYWKWFPVPNEWSMTKMKLAPSAHVSAPRMFELEDGNGWKGSKIPLPR